MINQNKIIIEKIMSHNKFDALMIPVSSNGSATYDGSTFKNEMVASNSGLPSITFPIGYTKNGMPVGVELIGKKWSEGKLIEIAYAYEQKFKLNKNPQLPKENLKLESLSIPEYNNLITLIGYESFRKVKEDKRVLPFYQILTPKVFNDVVKATLR